MNSSSLLSAMTDAGLGTLLDLGLKATLVALVALGLLALMRRRSAAEKHLVVQAATLSLLLLPLVALLFPLRFGPGLLLIPAAPSSEKASTSAGDATATLADRATPPPPLHTDLNEGLKSSNHPSARGRSSVPGGSMTVASTTARHFWNTWDTSLLVWVWCAGFSFMILRTAAGRWRIRRIVRRAHLFRDAAFSDLVDGASRRLGLQRPPAVLYSDEIRTPQVWGLGRTFLLLPAQAATWNGARLKLVALHELAHLQRRDPLAQFLGRTAAALYWFQPLVHWLDILGRRQREQACDDVVLSNGARASEYARQLLEIALSINANHMKTKGVGLAMTRTTKMEKRLNAILDPGQSRQSPSVAAHWTLIALGLSILVPFSTLRVIARTAPQEQIGLGLLENAPHLPPTEMRPAFEERDGEDWFDQGATLHGQDRFAEAIDAFERAAQEGYRPGTSYYNAACGYALLNDVSNALRYLEMSFREGFDDRLVLKDSDLDPIRSDPRFGQLIERRFPEWPSDRRLERAIERFESLQRRSSSREDEWAEAGLALLYLRRFDLAEESLMQAVELRPHSSWLAMYNLSCLHALQGDADTALDWLDRAIDNGFDSLEKFDNDPDLNAVRSQARFGRLREKAEDLSLGPFDHGWHHAVFGGTRWRKAVDFYTDYVQRNPQSGRAWFNLGFAQHSLKNHSEAFDSFRQALRLKYQPGVSAYNMACASARSGLADQAFEWLEQAEQLGFDFNDHAKDDDDLRSLRSDARFAHFRGRAHKRH